jgi:hypothetical protein
VLQRTREIGLRMAVGATQWAVRIQFLGERWRSPCSAVSSAWA